MYLVNGEDDFLVQKTVEKILKQKYANHNLIIFTAETNIEQIINELLSFGVFSEAKIIWWKNSPFLKTNAKNDEFFKDLLAILNTKNHQPIIFSTIEKLEPLKNQLVSFIMQHGKLQKVPKLTPESKFEYVKKMVNSLGGEIEDADLVLLAEKLPLDFSAIHNTITTMVLKNPKLSFNDVENLENLQTQYDPFEFVNTFADFHELAILQSYQNEIKNGTEVPAVIAKLANFLILASQVYSYKQNSFEGQAIANILKIHPFRIKVAERFLKKVSAQKLADLINHLADLDKKIKCGQVNASAGFYHYIFRATK
ncbi:DNA polymerase III subunit delta [Candidatus Mycoplasma pogonae]